MKVYKYYVVYASYSNLLDNTPFQLTTNLMCVGLSPISVVFFWSSLYTFDGNQYPLLI